MLFCPRIGTKLGTAFSSPKKCVTASIQGDNTCILPPKQHLENLFPSVCGNKWNKYSHCVHEDSFINENQAL
jgi:hypothetical protein